MLWRRHYPQTQTLGKTEGRQKEAKADWECGGTARGFLSGIKNIMNMQDFKRNAREWTESLIIAFILAMFIRTFFIQAFKIPSGSMRPTLIEGDRLLVNKLRYGPKIPFTKWRIPGFTEPQRWDIVVFVYPGEPKKDFIKRLIAKEGETIEIKNGDIYINGELVEDEKSKNIYYYNRGDYGGSKQKVQVPQGYYYVMGDNSGSSHDSRFWGFVPEEKIIGKAEIIYWPLNRIRVIK